MNIDVAFRDPNSRPSLSGRRSGPVVVNLSGEAMKRHDRIMEYRNKLNKAEADLYEAMSALSSANSEIDRLNSEVARLKADISRLDSELRAEREKNARLQKPFKKIKKDKDDKGSSDPVAE